MAEPTANARWRPWVQHQQLCKRRSVGGDFSQAAFCMRHGLRVEASTQAGDVFSKHQAAIKMFMLVDFSTLNDAAFRRISGITAPEENR